MANTWILIRHPNKVGDDEGLYLGDTADITDSGWQQMPLVTDRLKLLHPDAITCSLFPRAITLADHIAAQLGVETVLKHGLFNEIAKPRFLIGMRRDDPIHIEVMQAIRDQFDDDTIPTDLLRGEKIERRSELEDRVRKAFQYVESLPLAEVVLTVSHAKFIAALVHWLWENGTLKGYYPKADRSLKISTTGITILSREPNRRTGEIEWLIKTINEEAHIDAGEYEALASLLRNV